LGFKYKKNTYNLAGDFKYSFINDENKKGISSQLCRNQENIDIVLELKLLPRTTTTMT
jgi:hypothetical protein